MNLAVIAWLLVLEAPVSIGAAVFLWRLHAKSRRQDDRNPKPLIRLSLVLAVGGTIGAVASTFLGVASLLYLTGHQDIDAKLGVFVYWTFPILGLTPVINALYLRWLDRKPSTERSAFEKKLDRP